METVNSLPMERFAILQHKAGSLTNSTPINGDWIEINDFRRLVVLFTAGSSAGALNVSLILESATDAAGTSAQEVRNFAGGSILTNPVMLFSYSTDAQEGAVNRRFYRMLATGNTANATIGSLMLLGFDSHFSPASTRNATGVLISSSST